MRVKVCIFIPFFFIQKQTTLDPITKNRKLPYSEKATKLKKKSRYCVNVKTSGRFFSIFVTFSKNLNLKLVNRKMALRYFW